MTWQTLPTRKRGNAHGEMRLRIANAKNGRLNAAACAFLRHGIPDGEPLGVLFQQDDGGRGFCVVSAAHVECLPVSPRGNVTVSSLTAAIPGAMYPVTIMLRPEVGGLARLVFVGWQP